MKVVVVSKKRNRVRRELLPLFHGASNFLAAQRAHKLAKKASIAKCNSPINAGDDPITDFSKSIIINKLC